MITSGGNETHVVIVGGGAAALEAKYAMRHFGGDRVSVEVFPLETVISVDVVGHRVLLLDRNECPYDFLVAAVSSRSGRRVVGLPFDSMNSIPVDRFGLIEGCDREYAAGDAIASPVKFQGTVAEHADAVASAIAAEAAWPGPAQEPRILVPFGPAQTSKAKYSQGKYA